MKHARVLVIGAGGYIGRQLVPQLVKQGHVVRCLVRDPERITGTSWYRDVEVFEGDVLAPASLPPAFHAVDIVYYLVHSMSNPEGDFASLDREAAANVGDVAHNTGVKRIVYLGGLGKRGKEQSLHLKSRHEVGDMLRQSGVPVTEFRAAVIIGSGSVSFEMIHHLTNRLPVMICPRWVITRTQPIGVDDVIAYLGAAADLSKDSDRVVDIGGPEVLTYRDMMLTVARVLGLRRWLLKVPVLTPRLSSYWVGLVTPIPIKISRALIEGLRHETVCENEFAGRLFGVAPASFEVAVRRALDAVLPDEMVPGQRDGLSVIQHIEPSHILIDRRQLTVSARAPEVFRTMECIGGTNGWYYGTWLWEIRGLIDELIGGVGLRRGRRDASSLTVGDALDFWRVTELEPGKRLLLRAEMRVPGKAWLEFQVEAIDSETSIMTQTARFYPRGVFGLAYWYGVYPVHVMVFRGLASALARRAEQSSRRPRALQ